MTKIAKTGLKIMNKKHSTSSVQKLSSGMKLNRRQACQFLVGGPATLGLNHESAQTSRDIPFQG